MLLALFTLLITLAAAASPQAAGDFDEAAERDIVRLLNDARQRAGLPSLAVDERLTRAAREHTRLMTEHGQLSHQFPGEPAVSRRLATTGIRFNLDAENVALDSGTAEDAHRGLMNSPRHRANIMNPDVNVVGVGALRKGGLLYVTEDFARRLQEVSANEAEDLAAQAFTTLRRRSRVGAVRRQDLPVLRNLACDMARGGHLATRNVLQQTPARYVVSYTQSEPDHLPSNAARLASDPTLKNFAVGGCYGRTDQYPSGTWWMVMVFF
jgi:hypothetical protein